MRTVAILPIKSFGEAKQRLGVRLTPSARRALAEAMYSDVLVALRRVQALDGVLVVTADHRAQQVAREYGALVLDDVDDGHNAAASHGIRAALGSGAERVLLIPGDCPAADPQELDGLIGRGGAPPSVLIVPDRHGTGTNALLLTPPEALAPAFGPGSRHRHAAAAQADGTIAEVVEVPSLSLDVDTPADLDALRDQLAATRGGAAHTRGMINQLTRSQI